MNASEDLQGLRGRLVPAAGWALVGVALLAIVFFGGTAVRFSGDIEAPRYDLRGLVFGLAMLVSSVVLLALPADRRPSRTWCLACAAFPLWILFQLVPLPLGLVRWLSPQRAELAAASWPGQLTDCAGAVLTAADPPSWVPLTVDTLSTWRFLFQVCAGLLTFLAAACLFRVGSRRWNLLIGIVAAFAVGQALYGLYEWIQDTPQILWRIKAAYVNNVTGTLVNRNHYAMMMYLGLGALLSTLVARTGRTARDMAIRGVLALVTGIMLTAIIASQSRAGTAIALLVTLAAIPLLFRGKVAARFISAVILFMIAIPISLIVGPRLIDRMTAVSDDLTAPASRGAVLFSSTDIVTDFPVFGAGGGAFEWIFPGYRDVGISGRYDYAHNDYLQVLIETGFFGLALMLIPLVLYAVGWYREHRQLDLQPWPLWIVLAGAALHEVVDFGLQIPGVLLLFCILAGAGACGVVARGSSGSRLTSVFAVCGLLMTLPAMAWSMSDWPGFQSKVPWPTSPNAKHTSARQLFEQFRDDAREQDAADPAPLCKALSIEAQAQMIRPLAARYASQHALIAQTALQQGGVPLERATAFSEEVERLSDKARQLDPYNPWLRERLMRIALAGGDLERASEDATVAAQGSTTVARRVVRSLERSGLPAPMIGRLIGDAPVAFGELLTSLVRSGDLEMAASLISPEELRADPKLCLYGSQISAILTRGHDADPRPFLNSCLAIFEENGPVSHADYVRIWLIREQIRRDELEPAFAALQALQPTRHRFGVEIDVAMELSRWNDAIRAGRALLDLRVLSPKQEAVVRAKLGRAYAADGRPALAIRQYEAAQRLNPSLPGIEHAMQELRRGNIPGAG